MDKDKRNGVIQYDAIIIGAGISGLVAAHRLKQMGRRLLVIECDGRVGGVIQTQNVEGFLIEQGPNSLRGTHEFLDLVDELGLREELIAGNPRAPAYVYAGAQLHAVPMGPAALAKTKLISNATKLRLLREPFIKPRAERSEESIASFVRRRLGDEILDRMVAPFLSGVYAGDPDRLSMQACFPRLAEFESGAGSILRGAIRAMRASKKSKQKPKPSLRPYRLCSFRQGMSALTRKLVARLDECLLTEARVTRIERSSQWKVIVEHRGETKPFTTDALIVATPADAAAQLLRDSIPDVARLLAAVEYVSLVSVPLAYRQEQVARPLDGFGFLAPRSEGLRTLGSIWNSSLFAGRAPAGWILTNNFIGGATDPAAIALDDDQLFRTVHNDLRTVLGITGEPRRLPVTRYARAIPQYNLGHAARVAEIGAIVKNHFGLWLAGNYLHGVSLGDCIQNAEQTAGEIDASTRQG